MVSCVEIPIISIADVVIRRATKTKAIKAKSIQHILVDNSVFAKFLLATLEGNQVLKAGSMVCIGADNDVWQQTQKNLFKKYTVTAVDEQGWLYCEQKPENEVNGGIVEKDLATDGSFGIVGLWGEEFCRDGKQVFLQYGKAGDVICQNTENPDDQWIVARKMFDATYDWKSN
jgi:hypothetical protein